MLLDGLESVPWSRLSCTVGTAEHVPSLLRQLTSPSPKVRKATLWELTDAFLHQGSVWPAAVAAVPFLIELLCTSDVGGKVDILDLLRSFCELYYDGGDVIATAATEDDVSKDVGEAEVDDRLPRVADSSQPQRAAVRTGIPIYLVLLGDSDPTVRLASARLLALCRHMTFDPRPPLEAARKRERDRNPGPDFAVSIYLLLALGRLRPSRKEQLAFYTDALRSLALSEAERVAAALEVVNMAHAEAPQDAIDVVVNALVHPSRRLDYAYDQAVGMWGLPMTIGRTLSELPPARLEAAVPVLTAALPRIGRLRPHAAAKVLLKALFAPTGGASLPATSLTTRQRAALVALFAAAPYWRNGHDYLTRFGEYGLPETRPALADYLGLALPPEDALGAVEQPQPHRPPPFSRKAYQARICQVYSHIRLRRDRGYRFETDPEFDLYSPSVAYLFIFPKTPEAVLALERAVVVLDALSALERAVELEPVTGQPKVPMIGWNPYWSSRDTRAAGRAFMGRFGADDVPLTPDMLERAHGTARWMQIAGDLAEFLRELHATPLELIPIALPAAESKEAWERAYAEIRSRFFDYLPHEARQRIATTFEAFLAAPDNWTWAPVLVHGDFASHNIRCSSYEHGEPYLRGIQGWEHVGLGDPAADLAGLLGPDGYGEEFMRHFAGAYPSLDEEWPRARFYAWAQPLRDALATPEGQEGEAAKRLLAHYLT